MPGSTIEKHWRQRFPVVNDFKEEKHVHPCPALTLSITIRPKIKCLTVISVTGPTEEAFILTKL